MDLKRLECFVRLAQWGGSTTAAMVLCVAQPTLSKQVRQLEVELLQNLCARNGRGINLTEEGRVLLAHAKGILDAVPVGEEAVFLVSASAKEPPPRDFYRALPAVIAGSAARASCIGAIAVTIDACQSPRSEHQF